MPVYRKVKTCSDKEATRKKRLDAAGAILGSIAIGKYDIDDVFWTDECWFDTTGNRLNPQNDRVYAPPGVKKGDPSMRDLIAAPQKQRAPGIMAHMTVSSSRNGTVLTPHLLPVNTFITSAYYAENILENDVLPKIRAHVLRCDDPQAAERWVLMHDLATAHTAKDTVAFLKKHKVRMLPWAPKGADINPLDIFVWGSIKCEIQKIPVENRDSQIKLQAVLTKVISELSENEEWMAKLARTCRSVPARLEWITQNYGKQIIGRFRDRAE